MVARESAGAGARAALHGFVLAQPRTIASARAGGLDSRGPPARSLPDPAPQISVGRGAWEMTKQMSARRAVVLLSGGLDSATTLAIARSQGFECHALSVDYGQRHVAELAAAARVAGALGAHEHRTMRVDLAGIGGSALTDASIAVPEQGTTGIPVTYVPARNTIMLSLALAWAEVL